MGQIRIVFAFGWKYMRRYWTRLAAGIALGILFGASNASFIWATKTIMERFGGVTGQKVVTETTSKVPQYISPNSLRAAQRPSENVGATVDRWLPRVGRVLDWRQLVGGLLFLP